MTQTVASRFRFGILGTGTIARRFAQEVAPIAEIYAVASRQQQRADSFCRQYGLRRAYADYAALLADPEVDAVYIATPATQHRDHCLMAIAAGKPVLCEKPFTMTAAEAIEVATAARENQVFCMEAMWMRFNPLVSQAKQWVGDGRIGRIEALRMEIGFKQIESEHNRLLDPEKGGGALLDLGVYGVSLADYLLGSPTEVAAFANFHPRGVDQTVSIILRYPGALATLTTALGTTLPNRAVIMGADGHIELSAPFFNPGRLRISPVTAAAAGPPAKSPGSRTKRLLKQVPFARQLRHSPLVEALRASGDTTLMPADASGFRGQATEVMDCSRAGRCESDVMPLTGSISVMETLDRIRQNWRNGSEARRAQSAGS